MRIILLIVFYTATCVCRIAIGDIAKMPGRSVRYVFKQKSGTTRSGVSEMPINEYGIIQMINKPNRQSSLENRIDGFPQSRRNDNLKRIRRSPRKRRKCRKKSDCKIARRRDNYVEDDELDEQDISSSVVTFPVWQIPESAVSAINFHSTTNPTIVETEINNLSLLASIVPERLLQLGNLNHDRSVNEAIAGQYPNSWGFDTNVSDRDFILSTIANPTSEIKVDIPTVEGLNNKIPLPADRPGTLADVGSLNFNYPQGFPQHHGVHQRESSKNNVRKELIDDRLTGANKRFLLVPVSKNLYVLKNVRESPRTSLGTLIPKRYKLLVRNKDNATSASLSFKHMHHDAKDAAYLQRGNHRSFDYNANYLYPTFRRVSEETANPTENPASYPDFLYPGVTFQTRSNLIDATTSGEQIVSSIPDYANISFVDINLRSGINSYDSAFLSSSSVDIPYYNVVSKEMMTNDDQPGPLSATKLDDGISLFQQDGGNCENSLGELGIESTTTDFRDIFDTLDNTYTPATFGTYLTNDRKVFDVQNLGDDSKFSTGRHEDTPATDFMDNISPQYRAVLFPTATFSANEDNTFLPNITYSFVDKDILNNDDVAKDSQEYEILMPDEYNDKNSIYSNDFDYNNRSIDEALLSNDTTSVDLFLNAEDYITTSPLLSNTDEWPLEKAQSTIENSHVLLMAIKPLSSELQKLLSAVKLVNQSLSDVQSRLCDKKNIVRTERESKSRKVTNIAKLANKVDRYDSDLLKTSFNNQSLNKRRIKTKNESTAGRDVKIRRKTNDIFLNKLTTPFYKYESSISNSEVRENFLKERKLNEREFLKSGDIEKRRLPHSIFNRNLKSLTKNYEKQVKPIQQLIEAGLKRMKRTTMSIARSSRFIKNNVLNDDNFAGDAQNQGNSEISRAIISSNNTPYIFTKDNPVHFLSDQKDLQRDIKRAMSNETSASDKEKKFRPIDPQVYKEATAYLDVLRLLGKTEKPHMEHGTDVWTVQNLTESLPPLIFTTTKISVSTFLPYFQESAITISSTTAEKKEAPEMTESSLYEYITGFGYSEAYDERNYTRLYKDYEYEGKTSEFSEIISLTQSSITLSAFTITMPTITTTTLPVFYITELTILPIETAIVTTEIITEKMTIIISTITTETPITILENFTIVSTMFLTPFLEGITDITLKIKIPAVIETSIEETSALIKTETVTTKEEIVEGTSVTEMMQSLLVETDMSLYTFSTVSLFKTTETELTTISPTVLTLTSLAVTKGFQTATSESTFGKILYTTTITSLSTVLERTETILSTSTEVVTTTLIPEDESPVTQIEKTITAEETATETPTTIETATPTEIAITATETSTTAEISTSIEITVTEILTINKTLTTAETSIETSIASKIPTASIISTTIKATTITETSTPIEILTTLETPIIKRTTGAKTLTPIETLTPIKTSTTSEIPTSTIEISTSTEITVITEIPITETSAINETSTTSEIPTTSTILMTTKGTTITETLTPTEILTTLKTAITKETTGIKTLTPTKTLTPIKTKTTTEISSAETRIITKVLTINKTLMTTETSIETSTASEIPTTSIIPTITEATTITETLIPTEILTTLKTPITTGITSTKALTSTEILTSIETKTTKTSTTIEILTSTEITETLTVTEILTTIRTSVFNETSTTSQIPSTVEVTTITETSISTEISTTTKIPTTKRIKVLTPTIMEIPSTTETQIITETLTTEIPVISTTYITTKFFTTSESTTVVTTSLKKFFPTLIQTTFTTIFTTETAESISSTPVTTTSVKTTVPTLKLTTTTPLQTLITNTTLSETPYTTVSSTFLTTEKSVITTSFKTTIPTTLLKEVTTTSLSLVTSTILSEMPSTTLFTFLIEETTTSSVLTTSSLQTTVLPIPTTISTIETFLTTSSVAIYTAVNATVSSTTISAITTEIFSTTSPVIYFTTSSITKISITTPVVVVTGTTAYETTSTVVTSFFSTEAIESTTFHIKEYEETEEYKEYYESTKEEIVTSAAELTTEEHTTWISAEEVTIVKETIPMTYLPSFTTPLFIGTITEATVLTTETAILPTEEIVTVSPVTMIERISTFSEVTLISVETSTMLAIETSSLVPTVTTTTSLLEEIVTEITETSWIITTTERPEYATILKATVVVTLAPFSESILSILITSETPATTPEVISVLPKTVSEEFTMSMTESPLVTYTTKGLTTFIETTVYPAVSISTAITEETLEVETEYYIIKEPSYEEEYEEYDTEIPTGKWYYYDEYETTTKKRTTATVKYTKLPKEKTTSLPFVEGTTTSHKIETSKFTRYTTPSETISTYINVTSTAGTSEISSTEEEVTSTLQTSALTIIENVTMFEVRTEFTTSTVSEKTELTTWLTFGSTEEYTVPPSTIFKILTEPLEYLTIPPKYTYFERFTQIWHETSPRFITKPKKIPEIVLEKTTVSERVSTETEEIAVEKLTSFFVSSTLTTISEKETFEVHTTTMSTASFETEGTLETGYKVTTLAMTEEGAISRVIPFITSEAEIELVFTTTSKTVEREKEKEQLLRRLDDLKQYEREMAEREERLKEREKQWDAEKEKRRKMMREKEEAKNITIVTSTTEGYVTTTVLLTSPVETISTKSLPVSTTEIEIASPGLEIFITTLSLVEITTVPTGTIPFSITEEITPVTYSTEKAIMKESTFTTTEETEETVIPYTMISVAYTTEKIKETTTEESIFTTYAAEEIEETVILYTTEKSIYLTEEKKEMQITDYVTLTPYITTPIMDLYNIGLASIETMTPYTVEEMYVTSYVTLYSEPFASSTITSPITSATVKFITLPIATFSERFEEATTSVIPSWYTTEETYVATYTDIYGKPSFTLPILEFTSTTTSSTITEIMYDKEIERLKEKLRKKERELEEKEKILQEREDRLERDIIEFQKYIKEFEKKIISVTPKKSIVLTSLSTPVPPIEEITQLTTQIKKVTEEKKNRTTIVTSQKTEIKDIQEKKWTKYVSEEAVTQKEEEIATKRICLNVLENTTIPLDKRRRNIVTKKICLPHFPEKSKEKSVGRLSRRLLALQHTRKIRRPKWNVSLDFRCRRKVKETTRKIDNLQLSHHEWLSNETTKPLRHFKGFTRIYKKMKKFSKKVATMDVRRNVTNDFQDKISLDEQRYILDHHESILQPTTSMLNSKEYRKTNPLFGYDLISARKSNFLIDNKANVRKRDVSSIENNVRFSSRKSTIDTLNQRATSATIEENGFYTVNVLHLNYNEDKQTHEVISTKPDEDELTVTELYYDNYVTEFGKDRKITTPYYETEEEDNLKEDDDELADKTEKKMEDDEDFEDMIDNYMNYEEREASTSKWIRDGKFLDDRGKDNRMTENERKLLDRAWPTEKSTTYHLGGTKFWELDFITEPSATLRTPIDKSKTIESTRTTCFDVVVKNEKNSEVKSNVSYYKSNVYSNRTKRNVSIEKRNASLGNVTRKSALRCKPRTKRFKMVAKKLKRDSHRLNYSKRSFEKRRTGVGLNDYQRTSNEDSITAKSRKLCGINASNLKHQIAKHKDTTDKHKKKQPAKSPTLQNVNLHSLRSTDNCAVDKKNKYHKTTTAMNVRRKKTDDKKNAKKAVTHLNIIGHKNKSISTLHERKIHNCFNCICDLAHIVNNIKSLLRKMNFPLDEIKTLNCSEYKEIQDKIVISMDSDVEEIREFPQPHYNIESLKGQKYIKLEELEDNFKSDSEFDSDHDIVSLPGLNLNLPCNQDGDGITWLSSISRPSYTWKRTDGIALFGFVAENGDLELQNVNAKDTGNYTCVMKYTSPDNEEPVEIAYEIHLQVVTLPRYVVHGESRYHVRSCDERDLDVLATYLPLKLNNVICEADICNAYVLMPSCSRSQITLNILLVPSHIVKLMTIDPKHCNVFCLKAIQDKLSLTLSKNLQIFLGKTIIFRLPHYEQRLVPIAEKSSFARRKRGKTDTSAAGSSNVGLFSSCPAGYGLRDTRCVPCNMGTYSEDGVSHCKRCPPGTYQPNHGARVCRTCTNPMTKGCYNMLWNSFSAIMVTLASVGAMLLICLLFLWIICCAKKKFCVKRIASIVTKEDVFEPEKHVEEQPLIKDASENEDQQWDSEYKAKKKKGKFYVNKKRRKQNERRKYDKTHAHEDEWGSHRTKTAHIICPDSYHSHEDYNYYPKQSYRKGPRLPECDFDT